MKNNIDEDISNVNFLIRDLKAMSYNETFINSISNVLTQLNTNKYDINNYEERITSLKSELETYKKIAEKLARSSNIIKHKEICINVSDDECDKKTCEQCIIDWARKEVENEVHS